MVFLMGNYTAPWGITFNPFLIAQSGRPYNIVTHNDLTGDNFFNNRPSLASDASLCTVRPVQRRLRTMRKLPSAASTPSPQAATP